MRVVVAAVTATVALRGGWAADAGVAMGRGAPATPSGASTSAADVVWVDALTLGLAGQGFPSLNNGTNAYARLPPAANGTVSPAVWGYSRDSSGMWVQFDSDASSIHVQWQLYDANCSVFSNFPPTGMSGVDLYRYDASQPAGDGLLAWRWVATSMDGLGAACGAGTGHVVESPLFADSVGWPTGPAPATPTLNQSYTYRLHFPSYNGVTAASVGVPQGATLVANTTWRAGPRVVAYSTSIGQGGVSARPGVIWMNRLSRALGGEVVNLGFCGSCRMELPGQPGGGLVGFLSSIEGKAPDVMIVDCAHNMAPSLIATNAVPFITALREKVPPTIPIVIQGPTPVPPTWLIADGPWYNVTGRAHELEVAYNALLAAGVANIHYVPGDGLYDPPAAQASLWDPLEDLTFEGVHAHDAGHRFIAQNLALALKPILDAGPNAAQLARPVPVRPVPPPPAFAIGAGANAWPANWSSLPVAYKDANAELTVRGRAFAPSVLPEAYARLPAAANGVVRDPVYSLSRNSAGLLVAFSSDSPGIWLNFTALDSFEAMTHFSATGVSGADLYAFDEANGRYRHVQPAQLLFGVKTFAGLLTPPAVALTSPGQPLRYVVYLPTYNGAVNVSVGVVQGATLLPDDPFAAGKAVAVRGTGSKAAGAQMRGTAKPLLPVLWYGTSILEGGVTHSPAHIFTSLVSRALNSEVYNFGFSGNGKMEIPVAQFLAPLNASVIIVDCSWNMDGPSIAAAVVPLVRYFRANGHAATPVVLAEGIPFGRYWAVPDEQAFQDAANDALYAGFQNLTAAGDSNLYYVRSTQLWNGDVYAEADSPTAAGLHPIDAGHRLMAANWVKTLTAILGLREDSGAEQF